MHVSPGLEGYSVFQVTEELEKVKQEMEERGSSMTDGGMILFVFLAPCLLLWLAGRLAGW